MSDLLAIPLRRGGLHMPIETIEKETDLRTLFIRDSNQPSP
ncbi:hypothetical protein ALP99_200272 [Pseudomonas syringae pv. tomato]|uniref:Uncharacterized protein n=1 Tax=Pseudomonas cannabina TaxID=86840 RepID=A0A0P9LRB8_PSECA|nr:hypothetical protein ALO81_200199 [Pseudomonas cannabina]KPY14839.1 hypothetical protein ALO54_200143 [Pseudomonas syringae pv. philadelphi]RMO22281.1 hypothetical protein ALQ45_200093 [Pseudomonas amygdali pv. morsprunorum]RMQ64499.1 hypothetical protein ALQ00_200110 [Pseudomonas syringae pv. tomato]RMR77665.1 hypothetical protein ALP82_200257 [Pseudomonas savastanoi pv. fraxini]